MLARRITTVAVGVLATVVIMSPVASAVELPSMDTMSKHSSDGGSGHAPEGSSDSGSGGSDEGADRSTYDRSSATLCNLNSINTAPTTLGESDDNAVSNAPYSGGNNDNLVSCSLDS